MPFTSSHPALVLPLAFLPRKYISLTGLVIGSMMPDFEYFFRMENKSVISHTVEGIFLFCLPVGLLVSFIFHNVIRNSFIDNLPLFLKTRFNKVKQFNWNRHFAKRWFIEIASIVVGAFSHIFWDSFTHGQYKMFQHPSTAIGAIIICYAICKMPKDESVAGKISKKYWIIFLFLAALIMSIRFFTGLQFSFAVIGSIVVSAITACLISITVTSVILRKAN